MNSLKLKKTRPHRIKRGEWNALLLAAVCALLVAPPAMGAASRQGCEAVLFWLHSSAGAAPSQAVQAAHAVAALDAAAFEAAITPDQIAQLLATLENALPDASQSAIVLPGPERTAKSAAPSVALGQPVPLSPSTAPVRRDASHRLVALSLAWHEAAARSGVRTNRSLE